MWYHRKKKFLDGIQMCLKLSDEQFEDVLGKIHTIYKTTADISALAEIEIDTNISNEERGLILKTIYYLVQRFNIFILSPIKLQSDLNELGFTEEKAQILIKLYSEISRPLITNLDMSSSQESEEVLWEVKTTLSDPTSQKCKIPKAKITLKSNSTLVFDDLNHSELSKLFDQLEVIQSELDNLNK